LLLRKGQARLLEGREGTEGRERIHDGRSQHVGDGAGHRQAFGNQAPNHGHDGALAYGKSDAEQPCHEHACDAALGQQFVHRLRREIGIDETGNDGAKQNERRSLQNKALVKVENVSVVRRHRNSGETRSLSELAEEADVVFDEVADVCDAPLGHGEAL
jgi:hypothetical protein